LFTLQMAALVTLVAVIALLLTDRVRDYAIRTAMIDRPNGRSSHVLPTPRGGGLAIVLPFLLGVGVAGLFGWVDDRLALALVGGGGLTSAVGFRDDKRDIGAAPRAALHLVAAGWAVFWLGGVPTLQIGAETIELGRAGTLLAVLGVAWLINLYNFMDGIDGIASTQAVVAGMAGGAMLILLGHLQLALLAFLVAAASGGFLYWNWSPARIFMGDVGSGFLGFVFATLALASEAAGAVPLLGWLLLLGVFIFDASATLIRRIFRGERWYEAHRSHAYQRLLRAGWSHARASAAAGAVAAAMALLVAALLWTSAVAAAVVTGFSILSALYLAVERASPMPPASALSMADGATEESESASLSRLPRRSEAA
jgi:Fuc2NAc and GlcNAc transferase